MYRWAAVFAGVAWTIIFVTPPRSAPREPRIEWGGAPFAAAGAKGAISLRAGGILAARTVRTYTYAQVVCFRSDDLGESWRRLGTIVKSANRRADIGDGGLLETPAGEILYAYRDNRLDTTAPAFAINVAISRDRGKTWVPHSTVIEIEPQGAGPSRGFWSPSLALSNGVLQCYYDDEYTPWAEGFSGHQWLRMKRWNRANGEWERPVTVSRAHESGDLSRDGMGSVVEVAPGRLVCVLESVRTSPPHTNVVRLVRSEDGGRTWSWRSKAREVVWQPEDARYGSYCPWICRLRDGTLVCVFATNDGGTPDPPATPVPSLHLDVKYVCSRDNGRTWSKPADVFAGEHRAYMPGVLETALPGGQRKIVVFWLDTRQGFRGRRGRLVTSGGERATSSAR